MNNINSVLRSSGVINGRITSQQGIKGIINASGLISVNNIFQFKNRFEFPTIGKITALYIAQDENAAYRWDDEKLLYFCVGRDYQEISIINGGNANG